MNAKEAIEELTISMNGDYISSKEAIDVAIEALLKAPVLEAMISIVFGDKPVSCASMDVMKERQRQVNEEGFSDQHDDAKNNKEQLAQAAAVYALPVRMRCEVVKHINECGNPKLNMLAEMLWPWDEKWYKPAENNNRRHDLIKAAALIVAEIERLDRKCEANK